MRNKILSLSFYQSSDVVTLAQGFLGKVLVSSIQGQYVSGIITETEAYEGITDRACHAYGDRRTPRTEVMYQSGGVAYVYLCYGIHHLLNVITGPEETPHAVLIRRVHPLEGIPIMQERRGRKDPLCTGPGTVAQAFGIDLRFNGASLVGPFLWIEDRAVQVGRIEASPRIGVDYAGPDALLPYRFSVKITAKGRSGKGTGTATFTKEVL